MWAVELVSRADGAPEGMLVIGMETGSNYGWHLVSPELLIQSEEPGLSGRGAGRGGHDTAAADRLGGAMATVELTLKSLDSDVHPDWCPGCGDFGVLKSIKEAILQLGIAPHDVLIVSGIGCSSNLPGFIRAYGVHSLHGRAVPVATGAALANHALHVIAVGGDGDGYGIGIAHFIHAMRRNLNLTYIVMDNEIYGLTTGPGLPHHDRGAQDEEHAARQRGEADPAAGAGPRRRARRTWRGASPASRST